VLLAVQVPADGVDRQRIATVLPGEPLASSSRNRPDALASIFPSPQDGNPCAIVSSRLDQALY
jgi:hypothetical protein